MSFHKIRGSFEKFKSPMIQRPDWQSQLKQIRRSGAIGAVAYAYFVGIRPLEVCLPIAGLILLGGIICYGVSVVCVDKGK